MAQKSTPPVGPSSEMWGRLEVFVREPIQRFIQTLLEEEVTACLGCPKAARRGAVDAPAGMRNGYGRPRRLSLTAGTITVRRPRVRGLHERFVRRVLPLFKRRTREVGEQQPTAAEPRCGHHRITNVLDAVPRKYQAEARTLLRAMPYADTQAACEELRAPCDHRYRQPAPKAVERLGGDWARLVTFYQCPREHWRHLRTTNVVESPFAAVRLCTTAAKRFKKVEPPRR